MPQQFVVPQFIDVEDKILGPITTRQFVILLVSFGTTFLLYRLLDLALFLPTGVPLFIAGMVTAFVKINGMPFHFFLLNLLQTQRRPRLRTWNKSLSEAQLRAIVRRPPPEPPVIKIRKEALATNKLAELALVVNTGGVYRPEA